jgi:cytochrome P450
MFTDLSALQQTRNLVGAVKSQIEASIKPQRKTIFHLLLNPNATEGHVVPTVDDLADESFAICTAAADTTGNCMTIAAYNVVSNPTIYSDLKKELRENFPDATAVLSFTALERLPYLTAVIKEALR